MVTGATLNIGRAICLDLAAAGAEVAIKAMVRAVVDRFDGLNILVNNATHRGLVPLEDMTVENWRKAQSVIVEGTYHCSRAAIPHIYTAGGGTIVVLGGIAG